MGISMKFLEIAEPTGFGLRHKTPWLMPNGENIDIYLVTNAEVSEHPVLDTHKKVSDGGNSWQWVYECVMDIDTHWKKITNQLDRAWGVESNGAELFINLEPNEDPSLKICHLAVICSRVPFLLSETLEDAPSIITCNGCSKLLLQENFRLIADGCPCNSARGINHGLVPILTCTCIKCDPEQTGSTRY